MHSTDQKGPEDREVRLEYLRPREIDERKETCPVIYLPIGTIEWHGLHNIVGLDALKAQMLCIRAALEYGGVVHPPHYGAVGGLDEPHTFIFDKEESLETVYFRTWIEKWCREAARNGYRGIFLLTGHYGAAQQIAVREIAVRMSKELSIPVVGLPEYFLALDEKYYGDHAASFETSLMMELYPDSVDLARLGDPPYQGVGGRDPKLFASAEEGKRYADVIVRRMGMMSAGLPSWDKQHLIDYITTEEALLRFMMVSANEQGGNCWNAWARLVMVRLTNTLRYCPRLDSRNSVSSIDDLA